MAGVSFVSETKKAMEEMEKWCIQQLGQESKMSSDRFPMIEKLGLRLIRREYWGDEVVSAETLERVLEGGQMIGLNTYKDSKSEFFGSTSKQVKVVGAHTHTGLIIDIRPIEKPRTIEDVAKDLVDIINRHCNDERTVKIVGEAKQLLGEK